MQLLDDDVAQAASRLSAAASGRQPCAPVRDLIGAADVGRAYLVQRRLIEARQAEGARQVGWKIGLTSAAVQAQLGVGQPDFGALLDTMEVADGGTVPAGTLLQPRIEAEIAFLLGSDLESPTVDLADVAEAVMAARPALEIVDSRIAGWDITIADTVADNASSGLFVLGEASLPLTELTPADVHMEMTRNGEVVSVGTGAACLGDPLLALQWLARTTAALGHPLRAGDVVLSGALGPMVPVVAGDSYAARLTGLGEVRVDFATAGPGGDQL
jgi:2-keto-4-pentenoate hydratase